MSGGQKVGAAGAGWWAAGGLEGAPPCRRRRRAWPPPRSSPRRVEAVQQTLADLTGILPGDQILMCEGARLDGPKPLSAYGLPVVGGRRRPRRQRQQRVLGLGRVP